MKELDPFVFLAVFREMLGWWLWLIVAVAILAVASFVYTLVRDRGLRSRRFLGAQIVGIVGGFAALAFMWWITSSSIADVGGPIDVILLIVIWAGGFVGATILAYGMAGLMAGRFAGSGAPARLARG